MRYLDIKHPVVIKMKNSELAQTAGTISDTLYSILFSLGFEAGDIALVATAVASSIFNTGANVLDKWEKQEITVSDDKTEKEDE